MSRISPRRLAALIDGRRGYNLHSHTQFCDGRHPMEQIVKSAIDAGMEILGFSPHSPVPIESPCNMLQADVPAYLAEIERLRALYGDRITLLASMEIDWLGPQWGPSSPYFDTLPLDYRIGSIHFIKGADGTLIDIDGSSERFMRNMPAHFDNDIMYVVNTFFDATEAMIEAGGLDIIGHFDKVLLNATAHTPAIATSEVYRRRIDRIIDCIAGAGIIAEINTKARDTRGMFFPEQSLWPRLRKAGIPLAVNSDVHYSNLINAGRDEALDILMKL